MRPPRRGRRRRRTSRTRLSRCATRTPIRPSPTTPRVFSKSSTPVNADRFHDPPLSEACAWGTRRAADRTSAIACSAAETMFDVGALTTMTPAWVAALTSTLSRPTPARATTRSRRAARKTSASTCVAERTRSACAPATAASSAGRSVPSTWTTSKSGPRAATVAGESSSAITTTGWDCAGSVTAGSSRGGASSVGASRPTRQWRPSSGRPHLLALIMHFPAIMHFPCREVHDQREGGGQRAAVPST